MHRMDRTPSRLYFALTQTSLWCHVSSNKPQDMSSVLCSKLGTCRPMVLKPKPLNRLSLLASVCLSLCRRVSNLRQTLDAFKCFALSCTGHLINLAIIFYLYLANATSSLLLCTLALHLYA